MLSLACALGAVSAFVNPLHRRYSGELAAGGVAGLVLAATFALAPWPKAARIGAAVGVSLLGLVLVVQLAVLTAAFTDRMSVVRSTEADSGHEFVVRWRYYSVDRVPEIWLRKGTGPFSQESEVYSGPLTGGGDLPTKVRVAGENRIMFTVGDCKFASRYDPWTLTVDPVHAHRPGC